MAVFCDLFWFGFVCDLFSVLLGFDLLVGLVFYVVSPCSLVCVVCCFVFVLGVGYVCFMFCSGFGCFVVCFGFVGWFALSVGCCLFVWICLECVAFFGFGCCLFCFVDLVLLELLVVY